MPHGQDFQQRSHVHVPVDPPMTFGVPHLGGISAPFPPRDFTGAVLANEDQELSRSASALRFRNVWVNIAIAKSGEVFGICRHVDTQSNSPMQSSSPVKNNSGTPEGSTFVGGYDVPRELCTIQRRDFVGASKKLGRTNGGAYEESAAASPTGDSRYEEGLEWARVSAPVTDFSAIDAAADGSKWGISTSGAIFCYSRVPLTDTYDWRRLNIGDKDNSPITKVITPHAFSAVAVGHKYSVWAICDDDNDKGRLVVRGGFEVGDPLGATWSDISEGVIPNVTERSEYLAKLRANVSAAAAQHDVRAKMNTSTRHQHQTLREAPSGVNSKGEDSDRRFFCVSAAADGTVWAATQTIPLNESSQNRDQHPSQRSIWIRKGTSAVSIGTEWLRLDHTPQHHPHILSLAVASKFRVLALFTSEPSQTSGYLYQRVGISEETPEGILWRRVHLQAQDVTSFMNVPCSAAACSPQVTETAPGVDAAMIQPSPSGNISEAAALSEQKDVQNLQVEAIAVSQDGSTWIITEGGLRMHNVTAAVQRAEVWAPSTLEPAEDMNEFLSKCVAGEEVDLPLRVGCASLLDPTLLQCLFGRFDINTKAMCVSCNKEHYAHKDQHRATFTWECVPGVPSITVDIVFQDRPVVHRITKKVVMQKVPVYARYFSESFTAPCATATLLSRFGVDMKMLGTFATPIEEVPPNAPFSFDLRLLQEEERPSVPSASSFLSALDMLGAQYSKNLRSSTLTLVTTMSLLGCIREVEIQLHAPAGALAPVVAICSKDFDIGLSSIADLFSHSGRTPATSALSNKLQVLDRMKTAGHIVFDESFHVLLANFAGGWVLQRGQKSEGQCHTAAERLGSVRYCKGLNIMCSLDLDWHCELVRSQDTLLRGTSVTAEHLKTVYRMLLGNFNGSYLPLCGLVQTENSGPPSPQGEVIVIALRSPIVPGVPLVIRKTGKGCGERSRSSGLSVEGDFTLEGTSFHFDVAASGAVSTQVKTSFRFLSGGADGTKQMFFSGNSSSKDAATQKKPIQRFPPTFSADCCVSLTSSEHTHESQDNGILLKLTGQTDIFDWQLPVGRKPDRHFKVQQCLTFSHPSIEVFCRLHTDTENDNKSLEIVSILFSGSAAILGIHYPSCVVEYECKGGSFGKFSVRTPAVATLMPLLVGAHSSVHGDEGKPSSPESSVVIGGNNGILTAEDAKQRTSPIVSSPRLEATAAVAILHSIANGIVIEEGSAFSSDSVMRSSSSYIHGTRPQRRFGCTGLSSHTCPSQGKFLRLPGCVGCELDPSETPLVYGRHYIIHHSSSNEEEEEVWVIERATSRSEKHSFNVQLENDVESIVRFCRDQVVRHGDHIMIHRVFPIASSSSTADDRATLKGVIRAGDVTDDDNAMQPFGRPIYEKSTNVLHFSAGEEHHIDVSFFSACSPSPCVFECARMNFFDAPTLSTLEFLPVRDPYLLFHGLMEFCNPISFSPSRKSNVCNGSIPRLASNVENSLGPVMKLRCDFSLSNFSLEFVNTICFFGGAKLDVIKTELRTCNAVDMGVRISENIEEEVFVSPLSSHHMHVLCKVEPVDGVVMSVRISTVLRDLHSMNVSNPQRDGPMSHFSFCISSSHPLNIQSTYERVVGLPQAACPISPLEEEQSTIRALSRILNRLNLDGETDSCSKSALLASEGREAQVDIASELHEAAARHSSLQDEVKTLVAQLEAAVSDCGNLHSQHTAIADDMRKLDEKGVLKPHKAHMYAFESRKLRHTKVQLENERIPLAKQRVDSLRMQLRATEDTVRRSTLQTVRNERLNYWNDVRIAGGEKHFDDNKKKHKREIKVESFFLRGGTEAHLSSSIGEACMKVRYVEAGDDTSSSSSSEQLMTINLPVNYSNGDFLSFKGFMDTILKPVAKQLSSASV